MKIAVLKSQPHGVTLLLLLIGSLFLLPGVACADTYRVGPDEEFSKVSEVADRLKAGDIVEITGDITDAFTLTAHGTQDKPITIRGVTRVEDGHIIRPRITAEPPAGKIIICKGDWTVLEGLDISGQSEKTYGNAAILIRSGNIVVRNCRIHHCRRAVLSLEEEAGDLLLEFCEFDSNGWSGSPPVSINSSAPRAKAVIQHCYFHDGSGGALLWCTFQYVVVKYNWFENCHHMVLGISVPSIAGSPDKEVIANALLPAHADILGNVFITGEEAGKAYAALSLGGSDEGSPGNEGDYSIAHNLFVTRRGGASPQPMMLVHGNVDHVRAFNNVFLDWGAKGGKLYERGPVWNGPLTAAFVARRGHGEPVFEASHNWISRTLASVPSEFADSLRETNPRVCNLAGFDFRPAKGSSLSGGGTWPVHGRIQELTPVYEPRRGIPANLKPAVRREMRPPSIGPFEVTDESAPFDDDSAELVFAASDVSGRYAWPLPFAQMRRNVLELLAAGDPSRALACAKMQFLLSPSNEMSTRSAIDSIERALAAVDGDRVRADAYGQFVRLGAAGQDGVLGTPDDLNDPIMDVLLDVFKKPEEYFRAVDTEAAAWAALSGGTVWEKPWSDTGRAFERLENGEFDEAYDILVSVLLTVIERPAGDIAEETGMQRNQDILDRVVAGLSVLERARSGSVRGIRESTREHMDYARYGPQGRDRVLGTDDDVDLRTHVKGRGRSEKGECLTAIQTALDSAYGDLPHTPSFETWLDSLAEAGGRTLYKLRFIGDQIGHGKRNPFAYVRPTPAELYKEICVVLRPPFIETEPFEASPESDISLSDLAVGSVDDIILKAYLDLMESHPDGQDATTARACLTAYIVGLHDAYSYPEVLALVMKDITDGGLPVFLVEDLVEHLGQPFVAARVLQALDHVEASAWPKGDRQRLWTLIENAAYERIVYTHGAIMKMPPVEALAASRGMLRDCEEYLETCRESHRATSVRFYSVLYGYHARDFEGAVKNAEEFLKDYPDSKLVPNVLFLKGLALLSSGEMGRATATLDDVGRNYFGSGVAPKALYASGHACLSERKFKEARDRFQSLVDFYPEDPCAAKARRFLKRLEEYLEKEGNPPK